MFCILIRECHIREPFWLKPNFYRFWNLLAHLSFQHKIKIYLVKNLDFSHWLNFCVFIGVLVRLGMPKMLSVTENNHKICSKNHKLCTVKMKYQSPQKMAKNTKYFFPEGAYAQHKRRRYNLKGPRAARTCLVTLKRGLLTIQLVGFRGAAYLASHYCKKIFPRSLSCTLLLKCL